MSKGLKPMWVILEEKTEGKEHVTFVAMENICKSYSEQEINRPVSEGGCGSKKAFFSFILEIQDYLYTKKKKKECMYTGREYPLAFTVWSWLDSNVSCQFLLPFFYSTCSQR